MGAGKKKSFVLYTDYHKPVEVLSDADAGQLFKAVLRYADTGEESDLPNTAMPLYVWMVEQLQANLKKYEEICETRRKVAEEAQRKREEKIKEEARKEIIEAPWNNEPRDNEFE